MNYAEVKIQDVRVEEMKHVFSNRGHVNDIIDKLNELSFANHIYLLLVYDFDESIYKQLFENLIERIKNNREKVEDEIHIGLVDEPERFYMNSLGMRYAMKFPNHKGYELNRNYCIDKYNTLLFNSNSVLDTLTDKIVFNINENIPLNQLMLFVLKFMINNINEVSYLCGSVLDSLLAFAMYQYGIKKYTNTNMDNPDVDESISLKNRAKISALVYMACHDDKLRLFKDKTKDLNLQTLIELFIEKLIDKQINIRRIVVDHGRPVVENDNELIKDCWFILCCSYLADNAPKKNILKIVDSVFANHIINNDDVVDDLEKSVADVMDNVNKKSVFEKCDIYKDILYYQLNSEIEVDVYRISDVFSVFKQIFVNEIPGLKHAYNETEESILVVHLLKDCGGRNLSSIWEREIYKCNKKVNKVMNESKAFLRPILMPIAIGPLGFNEEEYNQFMNQDHVLRNLCRDLIINNKTTHILLIGGLFWCSKYYALRMK